MNRTRNNAKFKFGEGERVLCFEPDPTKARVLYDAKVLEIRVKKDGKGKKGVEYLIHFQGWNSSWDRYVAEAFILKDIEEHRLLQKELADTARTILKENRKKRQRIGASLRGADPKMRIDDSADSAGSSDEDEESATRSEEESNTEEPTETNTEVQGATTIDEVDVVFHIPESIKQFLEEDCINIQCHKKLIKLPCTPNVVTILEEFVRHYACTLAANKNPDRTRAAQRTNSTSSNTSSNAGEVANSSGQLALCKEFVDGLRISFDFLVDLQLLYAEERLQHEYILNKTEPINKNAESLFSPPPQVAEHPLVLDALQWRVLPDSFNSEQLPVLPCTCYGIVHLLRLLVKLPEVIKKMHLTDAKRRVVTNYSELLLQYLDKQKHILTHPK